MLNRNQLVSAVLGEIAHHIRQEYFEDLAGLVTLLQIDPVLRCQQVAVMVDERFSLRIAACLLFNALQLTYIPELTRRVHWPD
jgi:hypothetical protein